VFRPGTSTSSVVVVGSGPLPSAVEARANRGGTVAGTSLYLLDAERGIVLDSIRVGSDGVGEDEQACGASGCHGLKNALAADPAVLLGSGSQPAAVYVGDLDGRLWRADVGAGASSPRFAGPPRLVYQGAATEPIFAAVGLVRAGLDRTFVFVGTGSDLAPSARASPHGRLLALEETAGGASRRGEVVLGTADGAAEEVSSLPAIAGDVVFFSTTFLGGSPCRPGVGRLYALTFGWGIAYDWNGDGRRDAADHLTLESAAGSRLTAPVVADRHVYVTAGGRLQVLGDPRGFNQGPGFSGVRVVSWREVH
jgi:hypothetical protein